MVHLGDCAGGPALANIIMTWAQHVKWPKVADADPLQELGTTWVELAISYMYFSGLFLPFKRQDEQGVLRLIQPQTLDEVQAHQVRLSEASDLFSVLVNQVMELLDVALWPDIPKQMVKSLYVQGSLIQSRGYAWRAQLPCQTQVAQTVDAYFRSHRGAAFDAYPTLHLASPQESGIASTDTHRG